MSKGYLARVCELHIRGPVPETGSAKGNTTRMSIVRDLGTQMVNSEMSELNQGQTEPSLIFQSVCRFYPQRVAKGPKGSHFCVAVVTEHEM